MFRTEHFFGPRRLILVVGAFVTAAIILLLYPRKSLFPPLPEPNGYDVLVQAAAKITRSQTSLKEMAPNELSALVATNQAALVELRRGLEMPCAVPVEINEGRFQAQLTDLANLRGAALAMDAEALLLAQQGDVAGALRECLDSLRFSQAISRRGLLIDYLVGVACESLAISRMNTLSTALNSTQCRRAAIAFQEHESRRESLDEITRRDREWARRTGGLPVRIREMIEVLSLGRAEASNFPYVNKVCQTRVLEVRLFMLRLAGRAFELERGHKPGRASELVPDYLGAVPIHPQSRAPLELP